MDVRTSTKETTSQRELGVSRKYTHVHPRCCCNAFMVNPLTRRNRARTYLHKLQPSSKTAWWSAELASLQVHSNTSLFVFGRLAGSAMDWVLLTPRKSVRYPLYLAGLSSAGSLDGVEIRMYICTYIRTHVLAQFTQCALYIYSHKLDIQLSSQVVG